MITTPRRLAVFLTCAMSLTTGAMAQARNDTNQLQKRIEQIQFEADDFLDKHAVAYSQIPNFKLSGEINGSLEGKIKMKSPLGLTVLGTAMGLVAPQVLLMGAAPYSAALFSQLIGPAAGAALGATGDMIRGGGRGQIRGELSGSIQAEGWDNLDSPRFFGLVVIDTHAHDHLRNSYNELARGQQINPRFRQEAQCIVSYVDSLQDLRNRGRFATIPQARKFRALLEEYRGLVRDLKTARFGLNEAREKSVMEAIAGYEEWMKKRISILYVNPGSTAINLFRSQELAVKSHHPETRVFDFNSFWHFNADAAAETIENTLAQGIRVGSQGMIVRGSFNAKRTTVGDGFLKQKYTVRLRNSGIIEYGELVRERGEVKRDQQDVVGPVLANKCDSSPAEFIVNSSRNTELFFSQSLDVNFLRRSVVRKYSN
jgi:hypothetical protein